ncbi:MAG TPA: MaoC family dehydratase [Pseudomonadales bacterium]
MTTLNNVTLDEIQIGQKARYSKTCTEQDILLFAHVSGDVNPVHLDEAFASSTQFGQRIAHGMYTGALVSAALAIELPGPGTIYLGQELKFRAPVFIGDTITVELEVESIRTDKAIVGLLCTCSKQDGTVVASGKATVIAPRDKISIEAPALPAISLG